MFKNEAAMAQLLVRRLEVYGPLADEDKAALFVIGAEFRRVEPGQDLVLEGAPPEGVFVIVEGFACRYQLSPCGSRQIIAYLLPGDFCDLDVLLLPRMDHSIGTLSSCLVAQLSPATVEDLLRRPALARALRLATLAETATLRDWLVNLGMRQAVHRVAHLFCSLHARLSVVGLAEDNSVHFPFTQNSLADTLGMSVVHMNRSLKELRNAKLLVLRRGRLTIPDVSRLEAFAQLQPAIFTPREKAAA